MRTHRNMKTETNKIKEQKYRKEMKNGNKYIETYRKELKAYQYFHSYNFLKSIYTHYIYIYILYKTLWPLFKEGVQLPQG